MANLYEQFCGKINLRIDPGVTKILLKDIAMRIPHSILVHNLYAIDILTLTRNDKQRCHDRRFRNFGTEVNVERLFYLKKAQEKLD